MTAAIETRFRGVHFRSRLEARWAAMFDMLDWRWEYEPVDLAGYIPDFVLMFPAGPVLVEVKPAFTFDALIAAAAEKIDRSGWESENVNDALIVGATWDAGPDDGCYGRAPTAGALRQRPTWGSERPSDPGNEWASGRWSHCHTCRGVSVHHDTAWYASTCCRSYEGGHIPVHERPGDLETVWREAGNAVRWRGMAA